MALVATAFVFNANAQDDFSKGSGYHLIYLDSESASNIPASSITKDYRVDDVNNFLYVWENTYTSLTPSGLNWNGVSGEYLSFQVGSVGWSGFGFACDPAGTATKDMSAVTSSYTLHLAMKTTNSASHCISMEGGDGIQARVAIGSAAFVDGANSYPAYTNFTRDGKWHLVEIPMSEFFNKGLRYPAPFKGNVFSLLSGGVAGTTIALDAIFIYKKSNSGIDNTTADNKLSVIVTDKVIRVQGTNEPIEVYNIQGQKVKTSEEPVFGVDELQKGIYVVKSANATAKIVL